MERNISFSNALGIPEELVPLLVDNWACEYASLKKNGTPITIPLLSFPGEDGRTIDITTGLAYPSKAERARRARQRVAILHLFSSQNKSRHLIDRSNSRVNARKCQF